MSCSADSNNKILPTRRIIVRATIILTILNIISTICPKTILISTAAAAAAAAAATTATATTTTATTTTTTTRQLDCIAHSSTSFIPTSIPNRCRRCQKQQNDIISSSKTKQTIFHVYSPHHQQQQQQQQHSSNNDKKIKDKTTSQKQQHSSTISIIKKRRKNVLLHRSDVLSRLFVLMSYFSTVSATFAAEKEDTKEKEEEEEEPVECRNGALVAESSVPGAYQQMCMNLPKRIIKLKSTGDSIIITQGTSTTTSSTTSSSSVAGRTGVAIWNSSLLLTRLLDNLYIQTSGKLFTNKTIVELGCGTALASIACSKLGAKRVYATDGNSEVIALASSNILQNTKEEEEGEEEERRTIAPLEFQWGLLNAIDYADTADILIGSDLTYNSGSWRVLAETMNILLKPNGFVVYVSCGHVGFNVNSEINGFKDVVDGEGLEVVSEADDDNWPLKREKDGKSISLMEILRESVMDGGERGVLDGTGGARVILMRKKSVKTFKR